MLVGLGSFAVGTVVGGVAALWFAAHGYSPVGADAMQKRIVRDDFEAVVPGAKLAVSETWLATGRPPSTNALAGMHDPDSFRGSSLKSLTVGEGGRIVLRFDETSGVAAGQIVLVPEQPAFGAGQITWRCFSSSYPTIHETIPGCENEAAR